MSLRLPFSILVEVAINDEDSVGEGAAAPDPALSAGGPVVLVLSTKELSGWTNRRVSVCER